MPGDAATKVYVDQKIVVSYDAQPRRQPIVGMLISK